MESKKNRSFLWIFSAVFLLAVIVVIGTYSRWAKNAGNIAGSFFRPYLELANVGTAALSDRTLLLHDRITLAREIEQLRRRNAVLEIQGGIAAALMEENGRLRRHIGLKALPRKSYLHAEILLRDPYSWRGIFTINRGSEDGVESGCAVIECRTPGIRNIVGVVGKVEPRRSEVLSLGNPGVRLSARVGYSRNVGFLNVGERFADAEYIPIGLLPREFQLKAGEAVFTTGFERAVPAGLKIGEIAFLEPSGGFFAGEPQRSGFIKATADYNTLRYLIVVVPERKKLR